MVSNYVRPVIKFGADFGYMTAYTDVVPFDYAVVKQLGDEWMRVWLPWAEIETSPGVYDWSVYDPVFQQIEDLDMNALVVLYNIPSWAADRSCGPISDNQALANFIKAFVPRYQRNVRAWEFINEPDGVEDPHMFGAYIGCWGLHPKEYADSLKVFYETVKELDPDGLVFFGGLAYDNWEYFQRDFLANTLAEGAGAYFDGLSFHFYPINPEEFPDVSYKLNELRDIMASHGVTGKQFWLTETSMWTNGPNGLDGQRDYVVKDLTRAYCAGADNTFWFAIRKNAQHTPRLYRWLIDADHNPDNAHDTYTNYINLVAGGVCDGRMSGLPENVEAYQFNVNGSPVILAWTQEGSATLSIGADAPRLLLDREGTQLETLSPVSGVIDMPVESVPRFLVEPGE
jgi:hypothetical protein